MNKQPTTEQLRKYAAGQLSRAEQYVVERAALNDPFVADVLDGFIASKSTENDLAELQSRLQKRIKPTESKRLGIWWASAAAVMLSVGLGWIYLKDQPVEPTISMAKQETEKMLPTISMTKTEDDKKILPTVSTTKPEVKKPLLAASIAKANEINASLSEDTTEPAAEDIGRVEVVESEKREENAPVSAAPAPTMARIESKTLKNIQPNQITVRGVIKSADGSVLSGVSVNVKGENRAVNSDTNGAFSLDKVQTGDKLSFSYVGFDTKEITVKDSAEQQIVLKEDSQFLSEVVVTSHDRKAKRAAKKTARKAKREQKNK